MELSQVSNGMITYNPAASTNVIDHNTNALHSCDIGYYLVGSANRLCSGDGSSPQGQWSGNTPTCEGIYTVLFSIK